MAAGPEDPVVERLDDALTDARYKLNRVIDSGLSDQAESMRMLIAVREDLIFMARQRNIEEARIHGRIDSLEEKKVDKNPNASKVFWILVTAMASGFVGLVVWLIQGANTS